MWSAQKGAGRFFSFQKVGKLQPFRRNDHEKKDLSDTAGSMVYFAHVLDELESLSLIHI